jgi:glycosyltransferase involved in cell wall biosynthesis
MLGSKQHRPSVGRRIAFVINNLGVGGAERVFVDDMNHLQYLGWEVFCILLANDPGRHPLREELRLPYSRIFVIDSTERFGLPEASFKMRRYLRQNRIEVLYATLDRAIFTARLVALLMPSVRFIARESTLGNRKLRLHKFADSVLSGRVSTLAVVSSEVGRSVCSHAPGYSDKLTVIPNGVELPVVGASYAAVPNSILTVGRLDENKNQAMLMAAFARVLPDFPGLKLRVAGEGALRTRLGARACELGVLRAVEFLGRLQHGALSSEYDDASIFVLTSNREGCPNALLEAMAHGLPCIVTDVGGIREIIEPDVSGVVVPRGDVETLEVQLRRLLGSRNLRVDLGKAARARVKEHYSRARHTQALERMLMQTV